MKMRKIIAVMAAALMLLSILPMAVFAADTTVVFQLGADGTATHADGNKYSAYTEDADGYTLTLESLNNVYGPARDAMGNGCIKLGASSNAGSFSFTVPADVTSVIIAVGKYKANNTKLTVNGTDYTLTKNSNDGAYDEIVIDTTTEKTITLTTVSGGYRAMVNSITYVIPAAAGDCEHDWVLTGTIPANCTATGTKTYTCSVCSDSYDEVIPMAPHNYVDDVCVDCGHVKAYKGTLVFNLGADGSATHSDGSKYSAYTEDVDGYTLTLESLNYVYGPARDAKGNGCIKLGASNNAGSFSFTVPDDVTSVIIAIGKYKSNTTKLTVNGTDYTLTKNSNDGAYDEIVIDTTTEKTITLTTVSGGYRAMVNSITYVIAAAAGDCEHDWVLTGTTPANCTDAGEENYTCSLCGESKTETIDALGHAYGEATETVAPDCTNAGEKQSTCSVCGDVKTETVNALGHTFVDGFCSACGEAMPLEATITFGDDKAQRTEFTTETQKWENDGLTVTNNKGGSTSNVGDYSNPARFYKGSEVIIAYPGMTRLVINGPTGTYGDPWAATLEAASLTYTVDGGVYTVTFATPVDSITLTTTAQIRANSITVYGSAPSDCDHNYVGVETQAPTCTVEGLMTYTCSECGDEYTEAIAVAPHDYVEDIIPATCTTTGTKTYECSVCFDSYDEVIPLAPHNYVDDVCADCGHVKVYKGTLVFDADKENRTEYSTQIQVWESEGVKLTNNKGESTTNVGDYGAPGRFYKSSTIIIEFPEMSKLIINADDNNNGDYAWDATLDAAGLTYTAADGVYTITFAEPTNSITLKTSNQVRAYNITAIVDHECVYDDNFDVDCNKCGDIREVEILTFNGKSASEDVAGLAFLFSVKVDGVEIHENTQNTFKADSGEIELNGAKYTLKYAGAVLSNVADIAAEELTIANAQDNGNKNIKNIGAKYLWNYSENGFKYAIRIINIPEANWDTVISARPYYIYADAEGNSVIVYGDMQTGTYNATHG